jgi:thioredoxin-like negative regulator of GroEL
MRGVRSLRVRALDLTELGVPPGEPAVVQFTHPLCADCQTLAADLTAAGRRPVLVDVSARPDLARRYGITAVPAAFEVSAGGAVVRRLASVR